MLASQKAEPGKESNDLMEKKNQWLTDAPENGVLTGINRRTGLST
jgi:branched-subunit amino acid aminotransferase/4-amino-4-deoxychorismate lyase